MMIVLNLLLCWDCVASTGNYGANILNNRLQDLESERQRKSVALQKCEKEVENFKFAGLSTLALTGVGIYANSEIRKKINNVENYRLNGNSGVGSEARSVEQISADNISELCLEFPDEPECKK